VQSARKNGLARLMLPLAIGRLALGFVLFDLKKVPPPTPDGREGRLFPPEQSTNLRSY